MSEAQHQDPLRYTVSELMMMMMLHTCVKHVFFFFPTACWAPGAAKLASLTCFKHLKKKTVRFDVSPFEGSEVPPVLMMPEVCAPVVHTKRSIYCKMQ